MPTGCSVVIPTKDCLVYLQQAIQSVMEQSFEPLELIVVDDGSTDGTLPYLEKLARSNDKLVVLSGPGKGPALARNMAIEQARYSHIAFLDADDIWYPNKLGPQLAWHQAYSDAVFSFTDYRHLDPHGVDMGTCFEFWRNQFQQLPPRAFEMFPEALSRLLAANIVGTSTVVAKTETLRNANGFATDLPSAEDWDLWLRLAASGPVGISGTVAMDYLVRPGSETKKRAARIQAMQTICARYEQERAPAVQNALKKARANIWVAQAEMQREEGHPAAALRAHLRAAMLDPQRKTFVAMLADAKNVVRPKPLDVRERQP
ncbi:glycosyltransferase family 2 protein [Pseudovibrio exalbescens]|uniref:glycosyltransferase family 2 protein n=1 Tax=Pseudovibrio exalbescens TaxID=197461 RepID=UPI0015E11A43|nr:glycosyltransferase family A protein [Pseudovibrio exalbescens]